MILKVAGDGVEKQNLINLAANLDISELISFSGWIDNDDVPEFLSSLDIVVIPSRFESESFGVAAVESLAMGKPTIVSNVGGLPEVVENNIDQDHHKWWNCSTLCIEHSKPIDDDNNIVKLFSNDEWEKLSLNFAKKGKKSSST